jgi:hypothetical protein
MYQYQHAEMLSYSSEDTVDDRLLQIGMELEKKNQFLHFLQKELNAAKTETEKEAIGSILLKTKIQIRALERELHSFGHTYKPPKPMSQYFYPVFRTRRLH